MRCLVCGSDKQAAFSTQAWGSTNLRIYDCKNCGFRYGTAEVDKEDINSLEEAARASHDTLVERAYEFRKKKR